MKTCILVLTFLGFWFNGLAQQEKGNDKELKKELNLTDAQADSIQKIKQRSAAKKKALSRRQRMEKTANRAERKALHEQRNDEIDDVLTDEQEDLLNDYRERKHIEARKEKLDQLKKQLNVSAEQASRLDAANEKFIQEAKALQLDEPSRQVKMKELRESFRNDVKSILTAEQFEEWKEFRKMKRGKQRKR